MSERSGELKLGDEIKLRLVKTHETEVICDQVGHPLADVLSFTYETDVDGGSILTVKVRCDSSAWDIYEGMRRHPQK